MRKLATIREVSAILPIEGADKIVVAQIDGWQCVVKKDEFAIGDKVVYVEVDSVMPEKPEYEFLRDRKFRVRTIKLRGQISQGLVLPITLLPPGNYEVGDDVTDIMGIKKYDPQARNEQMLLDNKPQSNKSFLVRFLMRFKWYHKHFVKSKKKGGFPDWIKKTDEERIQNMPILFSNERDHATPFSVTEKVDGQSATYYLQKIYKRKYMFGVCSRNLNLKTPDNSSYWTVAKQYDMENVLRKLIGNHESVVLQGEICGTGIQKNKYHIDGYELFVFNLIYPKHKCTTEETGMLVAPYGLKTVPVVASGYTLPDTIADLVEYAKGKSVVRKEQKREGVVMRSYEKNISFKVINPEFLLTEEE